MKISIIIPVYNVEDYLRDCLNSLLAQTYTDFEVICVNDGSKDGSLKILKEYASKYPQFNLIDQENKGLSGARNTGVKAATGDYIFFLDSDDWIEPYSLERLVAAIEGEDLVCFNGRRYFEDGKIEEADTGVTENGLSGWDYYKKYALVSRKFHFVCTVLRLYRRQFLINNSLWFKEGIYHEDNLFTPIVCYYAHTVKVIPDCLYVYRIRTGSITQNFTVQNVRDMVIVSNLLAEFFIPKQGIDKSQLYREITGKYLRVLFPDLVQLCGKENATIMNLINWKYFKIVAIYPRHKRLYYLLRVHPIFFNLYLKIESLKTLRFSILLILSLVEFKLI